jgi:hypothetical protein
MFVCAGQIEGLLSIDAMEASQNITYNSCVGVTDVRFIVDVINRGGDEKSLQNSS